MVVRRWLCVITGFIAVVFRSVASADPASYVEPDEAEYWAPVAGAEPPFEAPRRTGLSREEFDKLILDGQIFVVPGLSDDWPMRSWDCDFFQNDPEFKKAAMNHQYAAHGGSETTLGDAWTSDKTPSGAANKSAPQVAPFYWGIKDVQYDQRKGWKKEMLQRVAKNFKVPPFMDPSKTHDSFSRTPEFWFGMSNAGAKAHMDSHIQATVSVQIAGTKRWRLMPLRSRRAPFISMIYSDGQPYENAEGWRPIFDITLKQGEALFFPPGIIHETNNIGGEGECSSSVTFQFDFPFAARYYKRFFPRVRRTADIHESWDVIHRWARLSMGGDKKGKGASYEDAKKSPELEPHFRKLDADNDGLLSMAELSSQMREHAINAMAWHDDDQNGFVSLEEFREGFSYWSAITHEAVESTPKAWRKFQLFGTIDNLEDLPRKISEKSLKHSLNEEARILGNVAKSEL